MTLITRLGSPIERATRLFFTRVMASVAKMLQDESLTVAQIAAVFLIDQRGSARVNDLAEPLGLSQSAASRMVDALVERGWVDRQEDPTDRRARVLRLTAEGEQFVARLSEERMRLFREIASEMPDSMAKGAASAITHFGSKLGKRK